MAVAVAEKVPHSCCNLKECSNYRIIALISHARKVMLKILQARLQQYVNCELSDVHSLGRLRDLVMEREALRAAVHGVTKNHT